MNTEQFTNDKDLLSGQLVRLTAVNAAADAEAFARWDLDSEYLRQLHSGLHLLHRAGRTKQAIEKSRTKSRM